MAAERSAKRIFNTVSDVPTLRSINHSRVEVPGECQRRRSSQTGQDVPMAATSATSTVRFNS
ncbi:hypothetical protein J6590_028019 [Homalodisca vitripennis]|nr:hypothetical protein J6590_028019 [Homalodisca vitripennis]